VREGVADIHQQGAFTPIYMRKRPAVAVAVVADTPPDGETNE
jgi:hypothetical protein